MLFPILFVVAFLLIGAFAFYLSRNIDHGEARFDCSGRMISDASPKPDETVRPARRIEDTDKTGDQP